MFQRVGLLLLGGVIYMILRRYNVPMRMAAILALIPFGIAEAKRLTGPYQKTAHEIMHERDDDVPTKRTSKNAGVSNARVQTSLDQEDR